MGLLERTKKPISSLRSGRKCRMKFELIRSLQNLEWYGNIPCLPINYNSTEGKRFVGEETDSWLLLEDFVSEMDIICPNDLDYGDVDYFDKEMCQLM